MAAIKGHVADLEVTPGITWSGPGDRKQPLQSWRCLQEICWHRDLSTLLSLYHTHRRARAHMFRNRAHKYAQCTHSHTNGQGKKKTKKKHMRLHDPHTQAHTKATAEWSQLERQRHFGLSTARISGQVRTTHTDGHKTTHAHLSLRRLTSTWNYCLHNLDPLWQNLCIYGNCAIFCL